MSGEGRGASEGFRFWVLGFGVDSGFAIGDEGNKSNLKSAEGRLIGKHKRRRQMKAQTNTVDRAGAEQQRLAEAHEHAVPWRKWGPYLSERQWGTVREDYSEDGNAWDYFSH